MRDSWRTNISFKLILQGKGRVSHGEIWWTGQECPRDEGLGVWSRQLWAGGRTKLGGRVGCRSQLSWPCHCSSGDRWVGQCCLLLGLSTLFLVAPTFYYPFPPAEAGVAGLALQMAQSSVHWEQSCCPALDSWLPKAAIGFISAWCQPCLLGCMWDGGKKMMTHRKYLIFRPFAFRPSLTQTMSVD